jgi:voltage-gated sodium channel type II alpha
MSEENGAIIVPVYYANLGSRHSSYTSHQSRISYTSHGDLLGGMTKESRLRGRSRNHAIIQQQPTSASAYMDSNHKGHREYVRASKALSNENLF